MSKAISQREIMI